MTTPCANCGGPLPEGIHRCPRCDALASPVDPGPDATEPVPWAIPMREPARTPAPARDPLRPALYAVVALAFLAGIVVAGALVLGDSGDDSTTGDAPEVAGDAAGTEETTTTGAGPTSSTTTTAPPDTSTTTTTTSTPSTTAPNAPTTTAVPVAAASRPGAVPVLASAHRGWVAQLTSVPKSAGSSEVEAAWSTARAQAPGAVVTSSDGWDTLEPGYWVVVAPGPFASVDEVRSYCASIDGPTRADCLPRQLTD